MWVVLSESAAVAVKVLDFCLGIATLTSNSVNLLKRFAWTKPCLCHDSTLQPGKTLVAVLLDLHVDKRVDPTIGTVAATRVRSRYDVLILRPVPLWLYQRKPSDGPQLLLQQLCGANIGLASLQILQGIAQTFCNMQPLWASLASGFVHPWALGTCQGQHACHVYRLQKWPRTQTQTRAACWHSWKNPSHWMRPRQDCRCLPTSSVGTSACWNSVPVLEVFTSTKDRDAMPPLLTEQRRSWTLHPKWSPCHWMASYACSVRKSCSNRCTN